MSLQKLFGERDARFTNEQILSLGIQLTNIFERIHMAGYVYNDLNLDNLLFDYDTDAKLLSSMAGDIFDTYSINIIDMSFATPYLDDYSKQHVSRKTVEAYRGSVLFSSNNHLNF